jgi:hypothetical protein
VVAISPVVFAAKKPKTQDARTLNRGFDAQFELRSAAIFPANDRDFRVMVGRRGRGVWLATGTVLTFGVG